MPTGTAQGTKQGARTFDTALMSCRTKIVHLWCSSELRTLVHSSQSIALLAYTPIKYKDRVVANQHTPCTSTCILAGYLHMCVLPVACADIAVRQAASCLLWGSL